MDNIGQAWASLGIAFSAKAREVSDPERTLVETLSLLQDERKFVGLILAWIGEYGDLVHVQRLRSLAKEIPLSDLCWLGGIASHAALFDKRWLVIVKAAEKARANDKRRLSTSKLDRLVSRKKGRDKHFAAFGLTIPVVQPASAKKLLDRGQVLKHHPWLRLRALFGTNWRADIAWLMLQDAEQTPYQVAKTLGCNMETAYRNWKALKEANATTALRVA
jgi:hypothetical protein